MPNVQQASTADLERPESYGLGQRREGVLMEVFVLTECGRLVGVFSTREKVVDYVALCPTVPEFIQSPDGVKTEDRLCDYRTQRVLLDVPRSDA